LGVTIELNSRSFGWGNSIGQVSRLVLDAKKIASGGDYALRLAPLSAVSIDQTRGARPWVPLSGGFQ
jgi:hypothetical protein